MVTSLEPDSSVLVGYGALLKYIKTHTMPIIPVSGIGESLPFKDHSFGLIYCRQVLHHASNLQKIIYEVNRVLVPGGIFLATREHLIDDDHSKELFLTHHALHKYTKAENAFLLEEYLQAFEKSKFVVMQTLLSWDSVINHYPTTNSDVDRKIRNRLIEKFGGVGKMIPMFSPLKKLYRKRFSKTDKTPGRMVSFIAKKQENYQ